MSNNIEMKIFLQKLLFPCFFILFLLSFFLIEGEYKFYLFAAWSVFLLLFSQFLESKFLPKSVLLALILSGLFVLNLVFSKHLPLSLEKVEFYILSLAIFVFFRLLPRPKFSQKLFLYYLSVITLILNFLVLFFTFYYPQASVFPDMNLLTRSHGHNHYVAFLLLVVPVFWWQFLFHQDDDWISKKESKYLALVLLLSSYILIIFSLARLALLISLVQLVLIFFTNKKFFLNDASEFGQAMVRAFIFAFSSIALVFLFLSMPLNKKGETPCPLIFSKKEICKPISKNDRLIYWEKAILIFKENPYFGTGLKGFNFASRHFPSENYMVTSYAHNIFLHNLAEGGLITGGFFIVFVFYVFYRSFLIVRHTKSNSLNDFLFLAVLASLINALFDFDWNFFVIFTLTLVFLALILQNNDSVSAKEADTKIKNLKIYFVLVALSSCFMGLAFLVTSILLRINYSNLIIKFFPYLDYQNRYLINEKKISIDQYQSLYSLYKNDPDFLYSFSILQDLPVEKMIRLQTEFANLDPLFFVRTIKFDNLDYQKSEILANKFTEVAKRHKFLNNVHFLDYWRQRNLSIEFFNFANQAYQDGYSDKAVVFYKNALILNQYVMGESKVAFFSGDGNAENSLFLKSLVEIDFDPETMNEYFFQYMAFYQRNLIYLFQSNQLDDFFVLSEVIFRKQPNFSRFLFSDLIEVTKTPQDMEKLEKVHQHFSDMDAWSGLWPLKD